MTTTVIVKGSQWQQNISKPKETCRVLALLANCLSHLIVSLREAVKTSEKHIASRTSMSQVSLGLLMQGARVCEELGKRI
jgi:hypothetical protein